MTLVRWNPSNLGSSREINHLVREFFGAEPFTAPAWSPALDVEEQEDAYVLKAELPGMRVEDVKIAVEGDHLVIRGEKRRDAETTGATYHHTERAYGAFERRLTLTKKIDREKIEALYRDGILTVRVPKAEEAKPREITIKIAQ